MPTPEPHAATSRHVDLVEIRWATLESRLIERLPADHAMVGTTSDYSYFSEPHSMDECPFRDSEVIDAHA